MTNTPARETPADDVYETPCYSVEEIREHDVEYINPLPRRTSHGVNGFAVQGRRDMLHHFAALQAENEALRERLLDALEYFEDREDVRDGPNGEPLPNAEMSMAQAIRDVLTKAGEKV